MKVISTEDGSTCPPGKYASGEYDGTTGTKCIDCESGTYLSSPNYLPRCHNCQACLPEQNKQTVTNCTITKDTVCECTSGFVCEDNKCDHCIKAKTCPPGEGVKSKANRATDTICEKCVNGTFSNVTDYSSPCLPHTRCVDHGRETKTWGNTKSDAVCGNKFTSGPGCSWMLPAGLWAGLVLTVLIIVAVFLLWRVRRKLRKADKVKVPVTLVEVIPTQDVTHIDESCHCQESCNLDPCSLKLFNQEKPVECIKDSFNSSDDITSTKVSVSFVETSPITKNGKWNKGSFFRLHSEPQEDEWCGAE